MAFSSHVSHTDGDHGVKTLHSNGDHVVIPSAAADEENLGKIELVFSGPVQSGFLPPNKATDNLTSFLLPKIDITATATALN